MDKSLKQGFLSVERKIRLYGVFASMWSRY